MPEDERGELDALYRLVEARNLTGLLQLLWKYVEVLKTWFLHILETIHPSLDPIKYEEQEIGTVERREVPSEDSYKPVESTERPEDSPPTVTELPPEPIAESIPSPDYEVHSAMFLLKDLGIRCSEEEIRDSLSNSDSARDIIARAIASRRVTFAEEWNNFKDDVLQLVDTHYKDLVCREEMVQLLAKKLLLNDVLRVETSLLNSLLTLKKNGLKEFDGFRLDQFKSAETLMNVSVDSMNASIQKNDPNLDKSRLFATLARPIAPKPAREQLKLLDAIEIMFELGSTIMPASIRLCDPVEILQQMINIGTNYKKIKSLAKLSTLLEIPTPVSTALSLAAQAALEHNDEACLVRYINEITKVRDVPIVHKLCVKIIKSSFLSSLLDDVYACALLNCPNDDLDETLTLIGESMKLRRSHITQPFSEFATEPAFSTIDEYVRKKTRKFRGLERPENCGFM